MQTSITDYHDPDPDPDTPTDAKNEIDELGDAPESFDDADDAAEWHQDNVSDEDYDEPAGHPSPSDGSTTLNVNVEAMQLDTQADGWHRFPEPGDITAQLDTPTDALNPQDDVVQEAIDDLTDDPEPGEFLVFDAPAAYEYLETLQKQSDLHLENFHRQQLIVNQLSNGRGLSKGSSLETYDKKWIVQWEVRRRMAERGIEEWGDPATLSRENRGLPDAE